MLRSIGGAIQLLARLEPDGDLALTAKRDQFVDARPSGALRDQYSIKRPAGAQRFADGMDSYQQGHYDKGTSSMAVPS